MSVPAGGWPTTRLQSRRALRRLLGDAALRRSLAEAAALRAEREFRWERHVTTILRGTRRGARLTTFLVRAMARQYPCARGSHEQQQTGRTRAGRGIRCGRRESPVLHRQSAQLPCCVARLCAPWHAPRARRRPRCAPGGGSAQRARLARSPARAGPVARSGCWRAMARSTPWPIFRGARRRLSPALLFAGRWPREPRAA